MKRRILIIEDETDIAQLVEFHLRDLGFSVVLECTGSNGLVLAERESFDLIILDLGLPGVDGLDICRQLRGQGRAVPILILTARSSEVDRVVGLEMGADDYLTKPFSVLELCARVKAIFRRLDRVEHGAADKEVICSADVRIDLPRREVLVKGIQVELTAKEFELLSFLASHPGRVFTRTQLLDQVWGYNHEGYQHTVNSHINRLRSKIEPDPSNPEHILTVWRVGYKFQDPVPAYQ
jgi:DNA-binding response OmpR family regulator